MRNFLMGLLLGTVATYYYLAGSGELRAVVRDFWTRASSPPAHAKR